MAGQTRLIIRWFMVLLGVALGLSAPPTGGTAGAPRDAVVIAVNGAIGSATAGYIVRSLREAEQQNAPAVVLRMDTPGGLDSAMRDIIRGMLASPLPVLAYVAPGGARTASAGTFILYAAALAAMAPGTNLGAAAPVSLFGSTPLPQPESISFRRASQGRPFRPGARRRTPSRRRSPRLDPAIHVFAADTVVKLSFLPSAAI